MSSFLVCILIYPYNYKIIKSINYKKNMGRRKPKSERKEKEPRPKKSKSKKNQADLNDKDSEIKEGVCTDIGLSANIKSKLATDLDNKKNSPVDLLDKESNDTEKKNSEEKKENQIIDKKKRFRFPTARIKRIMQSDDGIGKISTYAPVVLGKATELFLIELVNTALENTDKDRKMEVEDIVRTVSENEKFTFLRSCENEEEEL